MCSNYLFCRENLYLIYKVNFHFEVKNTIPNLLARFRYFLRRSLTFHEFLVASEETALIKAFEHHPQIGDLDTLKKKFSNTYTLAAAEQHETTQAPRHILRELSDYNRRYFEKFGFIFIICATGKSAKEMLHSLKTRIENQREQEIEIASKEQIKITCLRLKKLII